MLFLLVVAWCTLPNEVLINLFRFRIDNDQSKLNIKETNIYVKLGKSYKKYDIFEFFLFFYYCNNYYFLFYNIAIAKAPPVNYIVCGRSKNSISL